MLNKTNHNHSINAASQSHSQILRAYVARNNFNGNNRVILAEASSSMIDNNNSRCHYNNETLVAVEETVKQLHSKAPTPGWEYARLPRKLGRLHPQSLKGMKFHIYEDTEDADDDHDYNHDRDYNYDHDYNHDRNNFYIWEVGCIYNTKTVKKKQVESFIKHVVMATKQFREYDQDWKQGGQYAAQQQFSSTLRAMIPEVEYYVQLHELHTDIDTLKDIMAENIRTLLEREDKIEDLLENSIELKEAAKVFRKKTKRLKRIIRKKHYRQIAQHGLVAGTCTAVTTVALSFIVLV